MGNEVAAVKAQLDTQGYAATVNSCPVASKGAVVSSLQSHDLVHIIGHGDHAGGEARLECCDDEFLTKEDLLSGTPKFVYGNFCFSSEICEEAVGKGARASAGWKVAPSDTDCYLFANEFYALCFLGTYTVGEANDTVVQHHAHDNEFVLLGDTTLLL